MRTHDVAREARQEDVAVHRVVENLRGARKAQAARISGAGDDAHSRRGGACVAAMTLAPPQAWPCARAAAVVRCASALHSRQAA
jgi:hypothetical protein